MLRYIYVMFVGIFTAIFIGLGVEFFYASPTPPAEPNWYGLNYSEKYELTEEQRLEDQEYSKALKSFKETTQSDYNRNVSIIVICCAVLILLLSLVLGKRFGVIADGLLLGGIFTLLYALIRGLSVEDNRYRFIIVSIGLLTTIILGYIKFVPKRNLNS